MAITGAGRPRDPEVDRRIADAAVAEFVDQGWHSFTMDGVARRSGVGKASIYLRWSDKASLLLDSIDQLQLRVHDIDTGCVRGDLIALAEQIMEMMTSPHGLVTLRMVLEVAAVEGLAERLEAINSGQVVAARAMVRRAIARGELERDTSVTLLLDLLAGGIFNHVLATPTHLREPMMRRAPAYTRDLVDFVIRSFAASSTD